MGDDDTAIRTVIRRALDRHGFAVRDTGDMGELWSWIRAGAGEVVITDVAMPTGNGLDLLPRVHDIRPDLPVIVISARSTMLTALRAGERGAFDYFPKPFDLDDLVATVRRAMASTGDPGAASGPASPEDLPMVGRSAAMQRVYRIVARVVNTNLTVLVLGESGTGKELVARALHDFSPRRSRPFVALNMAAIHAI